MKIILSAALCVLPLIACFAQNISGSWSGMLKLTPQISLRLVFNINEDADGNPTFTLDSSDQGALNIPGKINFLSEDSINVSVDVIGFNYSGRLTDNKITGTVSQRGMSLPLDLTPRATKPKRPQTPVAPFPYQTEEVTFSNKSADADLAGTLTLPEGCNKSTPLVLMVTGSGLQNRDEEIFSHKPFAVIADYLARNGVASLRYDDRGFGKSTGDATDATTTDFALDAAAGMEFLHKSRGFRNVGILGHSEGATIAFILAGDKKLHKIAKPSFIVTMGAPAMRGDSILAAQNVAVLVANGFPAEYANLYGEALRRLYALKNSKGAQAAEEAVDDITKDWPAVPCLMPLKANLRELALEDNRWFAEFTSVSPSRWIKGTKCPALVLYGGKDMQVDPHNATIIRAINPKLIIKEYPSLNHLMQTAQTGNVQEYNTIEETISPEVLSDILTFIKQR